MTKPRAAGTWRQGRRESARAAVLAAAWELVGEEGLAALTLRGLARRAGITTPTVYAYFESKNAIFDAMFRQAAEAFAACKQEPAGTDDPRELLAISVQRFIQFCTDDVPRYQLLFQRAIPGFAPSPDSYAPAVQALDETRTRLAGVGVSDPAHVDLFTALMTGLVDQQISNEPSGRRWIDLADEAVEMFLEHTGNHSKGDSRWERRSTKSQTASTASRRSSRRSDRAG